MLNLKPAFVQLGTQIVATLLIVLAMFTVNQDIAQAAESSLVESSQCSGTATIYGMVVDPNGNPLADVVVRSRSSTSQVCLTVTTDAAGLFAVENLAAGEWTLSFESGFDAAVRYAEPQSVTVEVADGATITLAEPARMLQPAALVEIVVPDFGDIPPSTDYSGSLQFNPYVLDPDSSNQNSAGGNDEGQCDAVALYGPATVSESFRASGTVYIPEIAPGTYCLYATLQQGITMFHGTRFGALFQPPPPRIVEIPADPELVDLGALAFELAPKRISVRVVDEEGVGAAGAHVSASLVDTPDATRSVYVTAQTDQTGEVVLAVSDGLWEISVVSSPDVTLTYSPDLPFPAPMPLRRIFFAADDSTEIGTVQFQGRRLRSLITGRIVQNDGSPVPADADLGLMSIFARGTDIAQRPYQFNLNARGYFSASVLAGTYSVEFTVNSVTSQLFAPMPVEVTVADEQILEMGDIKLSRAQVTATVVGIDGVTPTRAHYGIVPIGTADALGNTECSHRSTFAYWPGFLGFPEPGGWILEDGKLGVSNLPTGEYCLFVGYGLHSPQLARDHYRTAAITFTVEADSPTLDLGAIRPTLSNKRLSGRVVQANGAAAAGVTILATGNTNITSAKAVTAEDGTYELYLDRGCWKIRVEDVVSFSSSVPRDGAACSNSSNSNLPNSFAEGGESVEVTFSDEETAEEHQLDLMIAGADATIRGTVRTPNGTPVGESEDLTVVAYSAQWKTRVFDLVDPSSGAYELTLPAGDWRVNAMRTQETVRADAPSTYAFNTEPVTVTVASSNAVTHDIALPAYSATISGQLLHPDGTPVAYGSVLVQEFGEVALFDWIVNPNPTRSVEVVNGAFTVNVFAGVEYEISAARRTDAYDWPEKQRVMAVANGVAEVGLRYRASDFRIDELLWLPFVMQP